ncbi:rna binding motif-containing zinc finger, partial [Cystoisospora suis]
QKSSVSPSRLPSSSRHLPSATASSVPPGHTGPSTGGGWGGRQPLYLSAILREQKPHLPIPAFQPASSSPPQKETSSFPFPSPSSLPNHSSSLSSTEGMATGGGGDRRKVDAGVRQGGGGTSSATASTGNAISPSSSLPSPQQQHPQQAGQIGLVAGSSGSCEGGEQHQQTTWGWTMCRNDKRRVQVFVTLLRGEVSNALIHLPGPLNVSHRSKWEEVAAKTILAVMTIEAAHPDQQALLDEYIAYFSSKERAGVANVSSSQYVYLVPPNCSLFARYQALLPPRLENSTRSM